LQILHPCESRSVTIASAASTASASATTASISAAASAASAARSTTPTTAATTRALFTGTGFVNGQGSAIVLLAVERGNRRRSLFIAGHLDEAETFASAGLTVADDLRRLNLAVSAEQLFQLRSFDLVAQITDI